MDIKDDAGPSHTSGLLQLLAPGEPWTRKITKLYGALQQQILQPDRHLANFATHASAVPNPFRAPAVEDRRLVLRIPDPPARRIYVWDVFEFKQGREALSLARQARAAVGVFVEGMLDAFEDAKREIESRRA